MIKQVVRFSTAVMTTLLALLVLWQFRTVVIYVLISLMLAAMLRPFVNRLVESSFLLRTAMLIMYLAAIGGVGFLLFFTSETAIKEIQQMAQNLLVLDEWRLPRWLWGSSFQEVLTAQMPAPSMLFAAIIGEKGQFVLPAMLGFTQGFAGVVSRVIIIIFLGIYWSIDQFHFERLWLSLLPSDQRKQARGIWRRIEPHIGAYMRGQIAHSLIVGLVLGLGYWLLGSPFPALLALVGATASLIPVVGAAIVVISVLIMGLLTSVQLSLLTTLYAFIVLIASGVWLKPRLFNSKWDNPIVTVVLIIALADAFGIYGIFAAPLVSAVCQILWSRMVSRRVVSGAAVQVSDLVERQRLLWEEIEAMDEEAVPLVTSSMERLTRLIEKAEPVLQPYEQSQ